MNSRSLLFVLVLFFLTYCQKSHEVVPVEIPLYNGPIPNARDVPDPEEVLERGKNNRAYANTAVPTLTIYAPAQPNGKAIILCPGGGYARTAFQKEGTLVAEQLIKMGITAFVLKYRIPQDLTNVDKSQAPLQDAQQAIRYARQQAAKYRIDPTQIGIMGFSAGGHLAAAASNHYQKNADEHNSAPTSVRPDFTILIYPVISFTDSLTHKGSRTRLIGEAPSTEAITYWSLEQQIHVDSPPAFLVHAADDKAVVVGNSIAYYEACLKKGVAAEMHLYPQGGHGFGLFNTKVKDDWMGRLENWLAILP